MTWFWIRIAAWSSLHEPARISRSSYGLVFESSVYRVHNSTNSDRVRVPYYPFGSQERVRNAAACKHTHTLIYRHIRTHPCTNTYTHKLTHPHNTHTSPCMHINTDKFINTHYISHQHTITYIPMIIHMHALPITANPHTQCTQLLSNTQHM